MATVTSSTSYVRDRIDGLRKQKRLMREVEQALAAKEAADQEERKRLSDHRIATKLARINGTDAPAPIEAPAPVEAPASFVESTPAPEAEEAPAKPKKVAAKKAPKPKKAPAKKTTPKGTKK